MEVRINEMRIRFLKQFQLNAPGDHLEVDGPTANLLVDRGMAVKATIIKRKKAMKTTNAKAK